MIRLDDILKYRDQVRWSFPPSLLSIAPFSPTTPSSLSIVPFPYNTPPLHFLHSLPCFPLSPPLYPFLFIPILPIFPILPYYFSLPLLLYSPFPLATIKFLLLENNETGFKKKKLRINLYIMISVRNKKGSETGDKNQVISS